MMLRYHRVWLALGWLWVVIVIALSLISNPPHPMSFEQNDKVSHFLAYGCLMLWFCQLYSGVWRRLGLALAFVAMGMGVEFLQSLTPDRRYDVFDMAANTAGVIAGWLLASTALARGLNVIEARYLVRSA